MGAALAEDRRKMYSAKDIKIKFGILQAQF